MPVSLDATAVIGNGFGGATFAVVGATAGIAGAGWIRRAITINRVAWNTAREDELEFFEQQLSSDASFREAVFNWQSFYETCCCACCAGGGGSAKAAERLNIARRRVLTLNMQLPPSGPRLLSDDNSPKKRHVDPINREFLEKQHLLRDPRYRNTPQVKKLREILETRSRELTYCPTALADTHLLKSADAAIAKELEGGPPAVVTAEWEYEGAQYTPPRSQLMMSRSHPPTGSSAAPSTAVDETLPSAGTSMRRTRRSSAEARPGRVLSEVGGEIYRGSESTESSVRAVRTASGSIILVRSRPQSGASGDPQGSSSWRPSGLSTVRRRRPGDIETGEEGLDTILSVTDLQALETTQRNPVEAASEWAPSLLPEPSIRRTSPREAGPASGVLEAARTNFQRNQAQASTSGTAISGLTSTPALDLVGGRRPGETTPSSGGSTRGSTGSGQGGTSGRRSGEKTPSASGSPHGSTGSGQAGTSGRRPGEKTPSAGGSPGRSTRSRQGGNGGSVAGSRSKQS